MGSGIQAPTSSRLLVAASGLLLCLVVGVAAAVGVYAIRNPNGIEFGPWPVASEVVAVVAALTLGAAVRAQRRSTQPSLTAFGFGSAIVALLLLGLWRWC